MMLKKTTQSNWHDYVEERLSAYIDGRLPDAERSLVRKHLNECEGCQDSLASLGWTIKLVKQLPAPPLPRHFTLPVPEPAPRSAFEGLLRWGLAGATAVAAFAVVFFIGLQLMAPGGIQNVALAPAAAPQPAQTLVGLRAAAPPQPTAQPDTTFRQVEPTAVPPAAPPAATAALPGAEAQSLPAPEPTKSARVLAVPPTPTEPRVEVSAAPAQKSVPAEPTCVMGCGGGGPEVEAPTATLPATGGEGPMVALVAPTVPAVEFSQVTTGTVTAWVLYVRTGPAITSEPRGWLFRFTDVSVLGRDQSGQWLEILYRPPGGAEETAWVSTQYITLRVPVLTLPVISPAPTPSPTPTPYGMIGGPATPSSETPASENTPLPVPTLAEEVPTATPEPVGYATSTPPGSGQLATTAPTLAAATPTFPSALP